MKKRVYSAKGIKKGNGRLKWKTAHLGQNDENRTMIILVFLDKTLEKKGDPHHQ